MNSILPEMKVLIKMSLDGASFSEIVESSEYTWLEMILGEKYMLSWYEMYIELSDKKEKEDLLKLPIFEGGRK